MRGNEVSYQVEAKTPPDCSENVASNFLHPSHHTDAVIYLGKELEQEDEQKYSNYELNLSFSYQFWYDQPKHNLHRFRA